MPQGIHTKRILAELDFVCWMPQGIHTKRILADPAHFSNTKAVLDTFFVEVMLPILLTERREPAVDNDSATNSTQLQQAICQVKPTADVTVTILDKCLPAITQIALESALLEMLRM